MIGSLIKNKVYVLASFTALLWGFKAHAGVNYAPLSGPTLPGVGRNPTLPELLNAILGWSVGLAAILAVIMLAIGGFNYMTSESVFKMGDSKEKISNAIVGLLIVLGAVFLLGYINPSISVMSLDFSRN